MYGLVVSRLLARFLCVRRIGECGEVTCPGGDCRIDVCTIGPASLLRTAQAACIDIVYADLGLTGLSSYYLCHTSGQGPRRMCQPEV